MQMYFRVERWRDEVEVSSSGTLIVVTSLLPGRLGSRLSRLSVKLCVVAPPTTRRRETLSTTTPTPSAIATAAPFRLGIVHSFIHPLVRRPPQPQQSRPYKRETQSTARQTIRNLQDSKVDFALWRLQRVCERTRTRTDTTLIRTETEN